MQVRNQQGFTLVEMLVAMALGSVIILGAGQLFLTTFKTFQEVDALSRKQEAIVFASQTISAEIRKSGGVLDGSASDPEQKRYTIACMLEGKDGCECTIQNNTLSEPVISFSKPLSDGDK